MKLTQLAFAGPPQTFDAPRRVVVREHMRTIKKTARAKSGVAVAIVEPPELPFDEAIKCKRGHPYTRHRDHRGRRECLECKRGRDKTRDRSGRDHKAEWARRAARARAKAKAEAERPPF